jgi:hypothetical protein
LIFIHGVKLLHTHSYNLFSSTQLQLNTEVLNTLDDSSSYYSGDCEICNYQLTKDSDHFFAGISDDKPGFFTNHLYQLIFFRKLSPFSSFENRGPPVKA